MCNKQETCKVALHTVRLRGSSSLKSASLMSVSSRSSDTEEQAETNDGQNQDGKNDDDNPHHGVSLLAGDKDADHSLSIANIVTGNDGVSELLLELGRSTRDGSVGGRERNASRKSGRGNLAGGSLDQELALVSLNAGSDRNHGLVDEQFEIRRGIAQILGLHLLATVGNLVPLARTAFVDDLSLSVIRALLSGVLVEIILLTLNRDISGREALRSHYELHRDLGLTNSQNAQRENRETHPKYDYQNE